ncbi:MAG: hypothetical protein GVY32_04885 [Gammaproteobacteria bacterium]|nr:hypothetical protein [Gammaproteobacteria bacterium]
MTAFVKQRLVTVLVLATCLMAAPAWSAPRIGGSYLSSQAALAWYVAGFELGPWEQYLIHELTPDLERLASRELPRISWLEFDDAIILPEFARSLAGEPDRPPVFLTLRQVRASLMLPESLASNFSETRRFEQSLVMPGVTHRVSGNSALTVSAVLASQRFGAAGMNLQPSDVLLDRPDGRYGYVAQRSEVSHGTGIRFAFSGEVARGVRMEAAFQSRIDMDEFASVRGVHGTNAELDIPPRLQLGLEFHTGNSSWLNLGVSQIFYSDVGAFPSRSLPARFTALLGDRNSPQFAWDDLTVYSLGWRWQAREDVEVFVDYRTRTQPSPSAPTLAAALDSELASNALLAGLSKDVGERSRLHFNAAYAPPEFAFGGNVLGVVSDKLDQGLEVQAMFSLAF